MSWAKISRFQRRFVSAGVVFLMALASCGRAGGDRPRESGGEAPWAAHIRALDEALVRRDVSTAEGAWHRAYVAALGSGRWEGMLEVGDAYLRIGDATTGRRAAAAKARPAYLSALFRARSAGSLDGVLRSAEAFAALGDLEVVDHCLRIAQGLPLAAPDARSRHRMWALRELMAARPAQTRAAAIAPQ